MRLGGCEQGSKHYHGENQPESQIQGELTFPAAEVVPSTYFTKQPCIQSLQSTQALSSRFDYIHFAFILWIDQYKVNTILKCISYENNKEMTTRKNNMRKCYCKPDICSPGQPLEHSSLVLCFSQEHISSGHTDVSGIRHSRSDTKMSIQHIYVHFLIILLGLKYI